MAVGRGNSDSRRDQGLRTIRRCSSYSRWSSACLPACSSSQALTRRQIWRSCPPAPTACTPPPGWPTQVHPTRPGPARSGQPRASQAAMDVTVPGHPQDAAPLAPRTRATQVDLPEGAPAWPATDRRRGRRTGAAHGQGEPTMGLRQDLRGAAQAWDPGGRHDHQDAAATPRAGPGATTLRAELDAVPQRFHGRWPPRRMRMVAPGQARLCLVR
jgi:hypothetical protein